MPFQQHHSEVTLKSDTKLTFAVNNEKRQETTHGAVHRREMLNNEQWYFSFNLLKTEC